MASCGRYRRVIPAREGHARTRMYRIERLGSSPSLGRGPRSGPQFPQGLARAMDLRRPQGRPADQQPRRTSTASARSSTASSPSAPSPRAASGASRASSRSTPPADSNADRCTTTSSTRSPPTPAATPSRCSPDKRRPTERLPKPAHSQGQIFVIRSDGPSGYFRGKSLTKGPRRCLRGRGPKKSFGPAIGGIAPSSLVL